MSDWLGFCAHGRPRDYRTACWRCDVRYWWEDVRETLRYYTPGLVLVAGLLAAIYYYVH